MGSSENTAFYFEGKVKSSYAGGYCGSHTFVQVDKHYSHSSEMMPRCSATVAACVRSFTWSFSST